LRFEEAIKFYDGALTIAREIGNRDAEGNHLGNLGSVYRDLGQIEKAIEYYEQALTIAQEIGDRRGEGSQLGSLGNAYAERGQVEKAIEYYNMAYALLPYESSVRLVRECCLQKLSRSDDSWEVWDNIEALALFEPITLSPSSKR